MSAEPQPQNKVLHYVLVLLMFACTGLTLARIGTSIMVWLEIGRFSWQYWVMWIALLPLYNLILLFFGFIFGKYQFVRNKQRKTWQKIRSLFGNKR